MNLLPGRITVQQLQRAESYGANDVNVSVIAVLTDLVTLPSLVVVAGDRIFINAVVWGTKGVVAGVVTAQVGKAAGTASVVFNSDALSVYWTHLMPASATGGWPIAAMGRATVGGTLSLQLSATSAGSAWAVELNAAQFYVWVVATG